MTPVLLFPFLVTAGPGIRVSVLGEGELRFASARKVLTTTSAVLAPNAAGYLADEAGHTVTPSIKVGTGALKISMNGTVTVAGSKVGRLVLQRPGNGATEIGFPGEDGMGILEISGGAVKASTAGSAPKVDLSAPTIVTIRSKNDVDGDRLLLKDIADIQGNAASVAKIGAIDLGTLPTLGIRRTVSAWAVKAAFRSQGIKESEVVLNFPPDVTVGRLGQTIDDSTLIAEATAKAQEIVKGGDATLTAGPPPLLVPKGTVTFQTESQRLGPNLVVTVRVLVDGKASGSRVMKFAVTGDCIKAGDAVRITISRNGAVVAIDGKARSAGYVGDTIQVITADGAAMSATITAAGAVTVNL